MIGKGRPRRPDVKPWHSLEFTPVEVIIILAVAAGLIAIGVIWDVWLV